MTKYFWFFAIALLSFSANAQIEEKAQTDARSITANGRPPSEMILKNKELYGIWEPLTMHAQDMGVMSVTKDGLSFSKAPTLVCKTLKDEDTSVVFSCKDRGTTIYRHFLMEPPGRMQPELEARLRFDVLSKPDQEGPPDTYDRWQRFRKQP